LGSFEKAAANNVKKNGEIAVAEEDSRFAMLSMAFTSSHFTVHVQHNANFPRRLPGVRLANAQRIIGIVIWSFTGNGEMGHFLYY